MCCWLWFCGRQTAVTGAFSRRQPLQYPLTMDRGRVLTSAGTAQKKMPADQSSRDPADQLSSVADQDASDTVGFGIGLGIGLETPLIDSLLERLLRRKQALMAAAAAAYPAWGGAGAGYYPNALAPGVYPFGGGVGLGPSWARPPSYPAAVYPFVPPINPYGGFGGFGGGGWGGGGGFNPLFDFDNDFSWKNNPK